MKHRTVFLTLALVVAALSLGACKRAHSPTAASAPGVLREAPADETADQFVARVNDEFRGLYAELSAAQWISSTYINDDSELVAAKANERWLTALNGWIEQARRYEGKPMSPQAARSIMLLKLTTAMPPPRDPAKLAELARIATRLEGMYGAGTYCRDVDGRRQCRQLGELEDVLRTNRDYGAQLDAWQGWHSTAVPMRKDYVRFVALVNEGAKDMGFADAGEAWRAAYDMPPAQFAAETDRLWTQVKPLYEQLHCYARTRLDAKYGKGKGEVAGRMLPAHLMGNMWQQDWSNLWDVLQPYRGVGDLDVTGALQQQYRQDYDGELAKLAGTPSPAQVVEADRAAQLDVAKQMAARAEDFYISLGMPKLPASYWDKSQFIKPRDRDVVCHASAWPMDTAGHDVRTKTCLKPTEEDLATIYHELGHIYYYLAYAKQPPIFQQGAQDGFHEAIGDTIVLSMTPDYLHAIGLAGEPEQGQEALVNAQMKMALSKVAFLPFGLLIDRWRWGVFDGSITPDHYNQAWWELKAKYQGVAPVTPRGEDFFDPGAKYHVPANTPYTRYFLDYILQFQFYKALCDAAGYKGPLYACSFYGSKAAGAKYEAMLAKGASQPWQQTLKEFTGSTRMDAGPLLEYFAPLQEWLQQQNEGQTCGWTPGAAAAPNTTPPKAG
ncbi:MAG: M2 family metallopeptidase [Lysobacter sp.]|nr:M2 family metallopeptidase [Lysobacter sp.]